MVVTPKMVETIARGMLGQLDGPAQSLQEVTQRVSHGLTQSALPPEEIVSPDEIRRALVIGWIKEALNDPEVKAALREQVEIPWEVLERINPNAAGLDIGAAEIWVCVPEGRDSTAVQMFPTFTTDLNRLADWLIQCRVDTVAMESTGVYWIPVYDLFESRGLKVYLVNARHVKNVPGKKTDVLDCQWLQQLHTYGLLQASFRPDEDIRAVRTYVRHRRNLLRYRAAHVQHMQKALTQMNLQLTLVLSDITGETGQAIIRAIVAGERNPVKLAQYRNSRCASSEEEIAKALTGQYKPEHLFELKQALELFDFYTAQLAACDAELEQRYAAFEPAIDIESHPLPASHKKRTRRGPKNAPAYDLRAYLYQLTGVDLTEIDGLDAVLAQDILSEIGLDMSKWPSHKHFTSWLRLSPHNDISGGKVLRSKTGKTSNRAALAFRMAALAVGRTQSALGAFFRRLRAKHGPAKAIVATACKIARIVYHMLKDRTPYVDRGADAYEEKYREQVIRNLKRKAAKLGLKLVPADVS